MATIATSDPTGNQVATRSSAGMQQVDMNRVAALASRANATVEELRGRLLAPEARKRPPEFSATQVATLCGVEKPHVTYRSSRGDLPAGRMSATRGRRAFRLDELQEWTREYRSALHRPAGKRGITIAVGNFKGGVSKTTTAMVLAQGLSMRGHRVLAIDSDPQGSLTTLFGLLPETEVDEGMSLVPLFDGEEKDIRYAIRPTYWNGIDLVAAAPFLFSSEFALPAMQMKSPGARFWDVLNAGLECVRDEYDVILVDTPPALSYVTINAFMAADGIIVPVPPSALDFASSAQFWSLFADLGSNLDQSAQTKKTFSFLHVLLSRVDSSDLTTPAVRQWIQATYGEYVLPVEIPKTSVTSSTAAEFGTVYDVQRYEGSAKTYKRAAEAYDRLVELVEQSIVQAWREQPVREPGGNLVATAVAG